MSKSAITFQLELKPLSYHAMFYKYVLYKIRVVNKKDLISIPNNILPSYSSDDENVSFKFFTTLILYLYYVFKFTDLANRSTL